MFEHEALRKIYGKSVSEPDGVLCFDTGALTPVTKAEREAPAVLDEVARLQNEHNATQYQRDRLPLYDEKPLAEQLGMLYHLLKDLAPESEWVKWQDDIREQVKNPAIAELKEVV